MNSKTGSNTYGSAVAAGPAVSVLVDVPIFVPAAQAWVLDPVLPADGAEPAPCLDLSSHQVYFFCSASACTRSGLRTCSNGCGSGAASESGVCVGAVFCILSRIQRPGPGFWATRG